MKYWSLFLIFSGILIFLPLQSYAISDSERTWYPGEGMKEGDFFEYEICYTSCSEKYQLRIWISSETENYRNIKMEIVNQLPETYYKISKTNLSLMDIENDSLINRLYREVNQFSAYIGQERKFTDVSWGKIGNIGGEQILTVNSAKYTVRAGSFEGTMNLKWSLGDILITDNLPYPIRAQIAGSGAGGPSDTEAIKFELIKYQQGIKVDDPEPPKPNDDVSPEILIPSDIVKITSDPNGLAVDFTVKAIDNLDGILTPTCTPLSGSIFPPGNTVVNCSVKDSSGNITEKSFIVTIDLVESTVPVWVKNVAGFWCSGEIDDSAFIQAIQYLITANVIVIPPTNSTGGESEPIPDWIKNTACWWSQNTITDDDFINGIQYLVKNGIINLG